MLLLKVAVVKVRKSAQYVSLYYVNTSHHLNVSSQRRLAAWTTASYIGRLSDLRGNMPNMESLAHFSRRATKDTWETLACGVTVNEDVFPPKKITY